MAGVGVESHRRLKYLKPLAPFILSKLRFLIYIIVACLYQSRVIRPIPTLTYWTNQHVPPRFLLLLICKRNDYIIFSGPSSVHQILILIGTNHTYISSPPSVMPHTFMFGICKFFRSESNDQSERVKPH